MENNKTFTYRDSKNVEHTITFDNGDFKLTQADQKIYDTKLKSKPTTFFKDAIRRFRKNKSSVAGAIILGTILLLTIFVPVFDTNSLDTTNVYLAQQRKLAPKLFDAGTGFWDGTTKVADQAIDFDWEAYDKDGTYSGYPYTSTNSSYVSDAIVGDITYSKVGEKKLDDVAVAYARGGDIRFTSDPNNESYLRSSVATFDFGSYHYSLKVTISEIPSDFSYAEAGDYKLQFRYKDFSAEDYSYLLLKDSSMDAGTFSFDLNSLLPSSLSFVEGCFYLSLDESDVSHSVLLKSAVFSVSEGTAVPGDNVKQGMANISCTDANATLCRGSSEYPFSSTGTMTVYHSDYVTGSFLYDTYAAVFHDTSYTLTIYDLQKYAESGWIEASMPCSQFDANSMTTEQVNAFVSSIKLTEEGEKHCPLKIDEDHPLTAKVKRAGGKKAATFYGTVSTYKLYGYSSMPRFLFGTDDQGRDMFKLVFNGLRFSVILGVLTSVVNLVIGLIWGAISGYFGGWVDILMERVCEILGGIPWVVVMTLILINKPDNTPTAVMVALALCATGWLGTAGLTRTQFYRFKDREYILAARTLGASDGRLIFRHILPNAIGTLITSSVLMIPSVIFSEASLSYLGLVRGLEGFGTILSDNQKFVTTYPYLILFPSVVMALIMISFNLFGNGLRDAFNPSLKGGE